MDKREKVFNMLDVAIDLLGEDALLDALVGALGVDELEENLNYIFRVYDLKMYEEEEEF